MKKITLFFVFLLVSVVSFTAAAGNNMRGDCNQDGSVNIADVTCLINYLLSHNASAIDLTVADCDQDGNINIADVTCLINHLLSGRWPEAAHEWVDLGLPSGTLWATCNIGASSPEDYGDYFAWGETEPKEVYNWDTYKWYRHDHDEPYLWGYLRYCTISAYGYDGYVDYMSELEPEDDAAYVNWGPLWRIPTYEQARELQANCSFQGTTLNGVNGVQVTGPNGKTLFMTPVGFRWDGSLCDADGTYGRYWTSTLDSSSPHHAYWLTVIQFPGSIVVEPNHSYSRATGFVVRPVRASLN